MATGDDLKESTYPTFGRVIITTDLNCAGATISDLGTIALADFTGGTIADLGTVALATFAGGTIADLGTVTAATSITTAALVAPTAVTFAGATVADLGTVALATFAGGTIADIGTVTAGIIGTATVAEIVRACDTSLKLVALTGTTPITEVLHEGKENFVTGTSAATYTLPEATGSGARYKFIIGEVNTSDNIFITPDLTDSDMMGKLLMVDGNLSPAVPIFFTAGASDNTITLNGAATGGAVGDWLEFVDVATDVWFVKGELSTATATPTTPFTDG